MIHMKLSSSSSLPRKKQREREMKKLCNAKGKKIHPSPPAFSTSNLLAALPAAILTLAFALSPEDKEVLFYLISGGSIAGKKSAYHHPPEICCGCFSCYKSFWARWDSSPNRHLIHQILDAVEESGEPLSLSSGKRRHRRFNQRKDFEKVDYFAVEEKGSPAEEERNDEGFEEEDYVEIEEEINGDAEAVGAVNPASTVRRLMSFIGEKVWGVWNK